MNERNDTYMVEYNPSEKETRNLLVHMIDEVKNEVDKIERIIRQQDFAKCLHQKWKGSDSGMNLTVIFNDDYRWNKTRENILHKIFLAWEGAYQKVEKNSVVLSEKWKYVETWDEDEWKSPVKTKETESADEVVKNCNKIKDEYTQLTKCKNEIDTLFLPLREKGILFINVENSKKGIKEKADKQISYLKNMLESISTNIIN